MKTIISMATIPSRKARLKENLPSIINQSYPFDTLILNILDNLSDDDYVFYEDLKSMDKRIILNRVEQKWRSCNKLLPALKLYPNDIIITIDDDIYYPKDSFQTLMQQWVETPNCIIAHEINPILLLKNNTYITYLNGFDVKLMQKEWGKYLSCCTLFPPHVFDNTEVFDYDKMMEVTQGVHDELWFWINSTLNGVMCVGLNYVKSFMPEMLTPWTEGEEKLADINGSTEKVTEYMDKINDIYGEKLLSVILNKKAKFTITKDNLYGFLYTLPWIRAIYGNNCKIVYQGLTKSWVSMLNKALSGEKVKY